jgi:hypothetical protein
VYIDAVKSTIHHKTICLAIAQLKRPFNKMTIQWKKSCIDLVDIIQANIHTGLTDRHHIIVSIAMQNKSKKNPLLAILFLFTPTHRAQYLSIQDDIVLSFIHLNHPQWLGTGCGESA